MPRIAGFDGMVVMLYFGDHPPPHVHIRAGRRGRPGLTEAAFPIETGRMISGMLPAAKAARISKWCQRNRDALFSDWTLVQHSRHPTRRYD